MTTTAVPIRIEVQAAPPETPPTPPFTSGLPFPPHENMAALTGIPDSARQIHLPATEESVMRMCIASLVAAGGEAVDFTPLQTAIFIKAALVVFAEGKDAGRAEALAGQN